MISDKERLSLLVEYKQAHTVENDSNTNTSECGIWKMIFTKKRFLVGESRRESGKGSCKCKVHGNVYKEQAFGKTCPKMD
jgi:hypothetical protein